MSPIDPRVQEALDDGRDPGELPADQRESYARLMNATSLLAVKPSLSVADRVMAEIRAMPQAHASPWRRAIRWLTRPFAVTLRLRPAWTLALAAAGVAVILLLPGEDTGTVLNPTPGVEGVAQFVGHFPGARSVEVVGSFNNWSLGKLHLRDENHDGIWRGAAVLPAGQHEYMFVVDGERWVADPLAGRYVDDGFGVGRRNALLIVRAANTGDETAQ